MASQTGLAPVDGLSKRAVEILRLLAEGLSDREIAERLVIATSTVKWYNRQIYGKLGVGSRTQAIISAKSHGLLGIADAALDAGGGDSTGPTTASWSRHTLPTPTTPFIGRAHELALVEHLLGTFRLLSLTGTGGIGKTRLALRVAEAVGDSFADGVYFVDLNPLATPARVVNAIAAALDVQEQTAEPLLATLKRALARRQLLLLIDNFEHVLDAAPIVSDLLAACPQLHVVVTSREALRLHGEQEVPVTALSIPPADARSLAALTASEAGELFVQRARMTWPDFSVSAESAAAVASICARLDGIPLAIELAAARIKVLSPQTLLARLTSRLETLTGGPRDLPTRQQTLRNTITWSFRLLTNGEQRLFARLAIFRGGCSLEAIEAVCSGNLSINVLDGLESLVNKNLILRNALPDGELRFGMLETLHEYAWERLEASGEGSNLARRHAEYFVDLAERAEPELRQAQQWHWFRRLDTEHDNLRAVLTWSLAGDVGNQTLGVRLGGALGLFWRVYGYHAEGRRWTDLLLDQLNMIPTHYHAKLLITVGRMALPRNDLHAAQGHFERALQVSRALGDTVNIAWALVYKGYTMMEDMSAALAVAEEGLEMFRQSRHLPGIAQALNVLGEVARFGGDDARAQQAYEECLLVSQTTGETRRVCCMFGDLTFLAQHAGEYERARELAEQGFQIALDMNSKLDIADKLAQLAGVLAVTGHQERAVRLLGAWNAAMERMVAAPDPIDRQEYERTIAGLRAQLDTHTFEAVWQQGCAMSLDQAVASVVERGGRYPLHD